MYHPIDRSSDGLGSWESGLWLHIVSDVTTEGGRVIVYMWIFAELETSFWKYLENGALELRNLKNAPLLTLYLEILSFKRWGEKIEYFLLKLNILW